MNAGRELDALIAEKVMGRKNIRFENTIYGQIHQSDVTPEFPDLIAKGVKRIRIPHYSTDISAAWDVVEKIKFKFDNTFHLVATSNGWSVFWDHEDEGPGANGYVEAETAPHAICLAALKAVGHD